MFVLFVSYWAADWLNSWSVSALSPNGSRKVKGLFPAYDVDPCHADQSRETISGVQHGVLPHECGSTPKANGLSLKHASFLEMFVRHAHTKPRTKRTKSNRNHQNSANPHPKKLQETSEHDPVAGNEATEHVVNTSAQA